MTTRREFIQHTLSAGALLFGGVELTQSHDPHKWLSRFCDAETQRYNLATPFAQRGHTYGTDGRAMTRVRSRAEDVILDDGKGRPNAAEIFGKLWQPLPRFGWTRLDSLEVTVADGCCPLCRDLPECGKCEGRGSSEGEYCKSCEGTGSKVNRSCPICRGEIDGDGFARHVKIGGAVIDWHHLAKLHDVPGVVVTPWNPAAYRATCKTFAGDDDGGLLWHSPAGIEGMICGLRL